MRKRLITLLVILLLITVFSTPILAINYSEAREDESLRSQYLENLVETYPPPECYGDRTIRYTRKDHDTATMSVNYLPYMIGNTEVVLRLEMVVYPQAFEEYKVEDDFISTLFHEYNHLRALQRDEMIGDLEDKYYMDIRSINSQSLSFDFSNFSQTTLELNTNISFDWKWSDLYVLENYESEILTQDQVDASRSLIRNYIRTHILELLAVEEEIYLHRTKLNPSDKFRESRFDRYSYHYISLMRSLRALDASEELIDSMEALFYKDWIDPMILSLW